MGTLSAITATTLTPWRIEANIYGERAWHLADKLFASQYFMIKYHQSKPYKVLDENNNTEDFVKRRGENS